MKITSEGKQDRGWGYEVVWASNEKYCGKILIFANPGAKTSMHFHKNKEKSWFVNGGQFALRFIDTKTAELKQIVLKEGDTYNCIPLVPYQLISMSPEAMIIEVSSPDEVDDHYNVGPGDDQAKTEIKNENNLPR